MPQNWKTNYLSKTTDDFTIKLLNFNAGNSDKCQIYIKKGT